MHPDINLAIADFFPKDLTTVSMVHPDTDSAIEHAAFALKAVNAYDRLKRLVERAIPMLEAHAEFTERLNPKDFDGGEGKWVNDARKAISLAGGGEDTTP